MYADFYNLAEEPFPVTPDPKYLYLSDSHKEALAAIVYGIENRRGFVAIVGEVGTGKTTILRAYLDAVDKSQLTIIYVFNPEVTFDELVVLIATELGIYSAEHNTAAHVSLIHRTLIDEYENGKTVVLIIDEAQNTPIATLESLRMLSNIETEQNKLLQIVLVGQPELQTLLQRHELRQLNQRIAVKSVIMPLSATDSRRYIDDRLELVANDHQAVFEESALARIIQYADGIPRSINIACDMALINGFGHKARPVTDRIAEEAITSLTASGESRMSLWKPAMGVLATTVLVGAAFWAGINWQDRLAGSDSLASAESEQPVIEQSVPKGEVMTTSENSSVKPTALTSAVAPQPAPQPETPVQQASESARGLNSEVNAEAASEVAVYPPPDSQVDVGTNTVEGAIILESRFTELVAADRVAIPNYGSELWERVRWDTRPLPASRFPLRYTVGLGDILSQLCLEIYGFSSAEVHSFVRFNNPDLVNVDDLEVGDTIHFPALNNELQRLRSAAIKRKVRLSSMPAGRVP